MSSPQQFIKDIKKTAKEHGITIRLVNNKRIYAPEDKEPCSGYFDSEEMTLAVSTKRRLDSYYGLLAHESSHMDQFINNKYLWNKHEPGYTLFFEWLYNKEDMDLKMIEEAMQDIIRVELDCERRAIKKIKQYNLPIDIPKYIQGVNAYLHGYLFAFENRLWVPQIYETQSLVDTCSTKFKTHYTKIPIRLHQKMRKIYSTQKIVS